MEDLLASIRGAYTKALAEGRTPTDAFPWLAHTSSKTLPSPELATIHQFYHNVVGSGPPPEAVFVEEKLAAGTEAMKGAFQVLCGPVEVPHKPAERMLEQRGVGGVWVAWPNADTSDSAPTVLYLHGGGMVQGTCDWTFGFLGRLSRAFGLRVLSVEYPLCPGATAVEAVDGMVSAFRHLTEDLKVPAEQVLLVGESGGGQAALLTLQALVAKGLPVPAGAWISCPVTRNDEESFARGFEVKADGMLGDKGCMRYVADLIRHKGKPDELPYAHPSYSPYYGSVEGFPPCFFSWDRDEVLALDAESMVAKLREAGVEVGTSVTGYGQHALLLWPAPESLEDLSRAAAWLTPRLGTKPRA